ncbi:MAG: hypothetical protein AAB973_01895 [Patescibacteria group bacterium]
MVPYQTKTSIVSGSEYKEVHKKILDYFQTIKAKTKRKPYVRSPFFHKEKVFFDFFWTHLFQKSNWKDRTRRLKFFPAAVDLIKNTHQRPESKPNPNKKSETLHRFAGLTKEKQLFFVQIKENKRTKTKQLISIFPA